MTNLRVAALLPAAAAVLLVPACVEAPQRAPTRAPARTLMHPAPREPRQRDPARPQPVRSADPEVARGIEEIVPPLLEDWWELEDEALRARIDLLGRLGPPARAAIPVLMDMTSGTSDHVDAAKTALDRIDPARTERVPALIDRIGWITGGYDADAELLALGPRVVPALVEALSREDGNVSFGAIRLVARFGPDAAPAREELARIHGTYGHPHGDLAGYALHRIDPNTPGLLVSLLIVEDTSHWGVDRARIAPAPGQEQERVRELVELVVGPPSGARFLAALELVRSGAGAAAGTARLREGLDAVDADGRTLSAVVLAHLEPDTPGVAEGVVGAVVHAHERVRRAGAEALVALGTRAAPAEDALLELAREGSNGPAAQAVRALGVLRSEEALPLMLRHLEGSRGEDFRWHAADALGCYGARASGAVPALTAALSEEFRIRRGGHWGRLHDERGRYWAARNLGRVGPAAAPAAPALLRCFADSTLGQEILVEALAGIGEPALPALRAALGDADPAIRAGAAGAIRLIEAR